jgi:anti-sigma factor RsiW
MSRKEHPIWEDELMPYVDGQLDAVQAASVAEHLESCKDCASSVANTRRLSQQISGWKVEDSSERMKERVLAELTSRSVDKQPQTRWAWWTKRRVWAFGLSGAFAGLVIIAVASTLRNNEEHMALTTASPRVAQLEVGVTQPAAMQSAQMPQGQQGQQGQGQQGQQGGEFFAKRAESKTASQSTDAPSGPMIIRSARLSIIAKDFEGARSNLETIVRQSQGYLDQLTVKGEAGSGRVLTATLRLPSDRMDTGLSDLRKLGKVREESQNSSDITSQYVDLGARLANARNTESRFQTILKERTGKLSDVVDVEREISRIREQIERMEAQQKEMNNRVQYASIQIEMSEEYHARIEQSVPSAATSLWNASVEGYHTAVDSLLDLALLMLRYGPALVIWLVLLLPVALFLRRIRRIRFFQS